MNATERAKVKALGTLRIPEFGHSARLIKNLRWRIDHAPEHPLTPHEKYLLDLACWRYRNSLGGVVDFDLPAQEPASSDYTPRSKPRAQATFL